VSEEPRPNVKVTNKRVITDQHAEVPQSPTPEMEFQAGSTTEEAAAAPVDSISDSSASSASAADEYLEDLRRVKAEFENYRKRIIKEQTLLAERASAGVIERILPVLDDFELALMAADRTKDYESMVRGVELVYSKLREVL